MTIKQAEQKMRGPINKLASFDIEDEALNQAVLDVLGTWGDILRQNIEDQRKLLEYIDKQRGHEKTPLT